MSLRSRRSFLALALASVAAASGCAEGSVSGASPTATGADGAKLKEVKVGLFPSTSVAVFELGKRKGFFEKQGLVVKRVVGQGSSAHLPALSSGSIDFLVTSPTTSIIAVSKGLDVPIVSGFVHNKPDVVEDSTVVVSKDPAIKTAKDLVGKTVSVNALAGAGEIGIKEAVAMAGGDPNKVKFTQLGFPEVSAQLESGQIDAGMTGLPFTAQVTGSGGHVVSDFIHDTGLGNAELVVASNGRLIKSDPETINKFKAALAETLAFAEDHPDELIALLPELLGTKPEAAKKSVFPEWNGELDEKSVEQFVKLMEKYGLVSSAPAMDKLVWKG